ncbi:solanesyl diphosphate synthase 2, chloroplastic-like isoform X2 [Gastrolobium bilobum]|uniref:solanesyl diphosphate synthase 2, chloroplastic-like isoform X2 n=1 Tax=Gastrolobium bilobum TaxID=150636 RepID=UPI002AB24EBF|nr:solanesyl diphosphate synthase 2, chloroplastic-like isoform X2 [Gastrolobium bilobum]XP_061365313.1 solanesyl diphosphate synthase 2, chloroplastic-like isoform X2 [Gastrolobium bilobum]
MGFVIWDRMMPLTSKSMDFAGKNLVSCGCSSNASFDRYTVRNYAKVDSKGCGRGHGTRKLICCKSRSMKSRVSSMKTAEPTVDGGTQAIKGLTGGLGLKSYSETPISPTRLFEVVADDLQTLNKNLQSIVGAENPVLMSAAEQIFSAGGKRMRPALVFLVSRATAELLGLKELTVKHRRLAEIIEMIHTASLIHDDVLDESDLRRVYEYVNNGNLEQWLHGADSHPWISYLGSTYQDSPWHNQSVLTHLHWNIHELQLQSGRHNNPVQLQLHSLIPKLIKCIYEGKKYFLT